MQLISDNIRTRTAIPNNSAVVGFVNSTSIPVWRMLSIGNTIPGSGLADMMIGNYREVIAADYAFTFLNQFANVAISALTKQHRLNDEQRKPGTTTARRRSEVHEPAPARAGHLYRKVTAVSTVATDMERLGATSARACRCTHGHARLLQPAPNKGPAQVTEAQSCRKSSRTTTAKRWQGHLQRHRRDHGLGHLREVPSPPLPSAASPLRWWPTLFPAREAGRMAVARVR